MTFRRVRLSEGVVIVAVLAIIAASSLAVYIFVIAPNTKASIQAEEKAQQEPIKDGNDIKSNEDLNEASKSLDTLEIGTDGLDELDQQTKDL